MGIIAWIVFGFIIGLIARAIFVGLPEAQLIGGHADDPARVFPDPDPVESRWLVSEYRVLLSEGTIAWDVEAFAMRHSEVRIGVYPHAQRFPHEVTVRLRCNPRHPELVAAFEQLMADIKRKHGVGE